MRLPAAGRYFVQQIADPARMHFYVMEADGTGLRRTADAVPTDYWYAWPSPDGRHVAYRDEGSSHLISLDDGVSRLVFEWQDTVHNLNWFEVAPGWSPDGRQLAWTDRTALRVLDTEGVLDSGSLRVGQDL